MILNVAPQKLEKVIYYASYIVIKVSAEAKKQALEDLGREFKSRKKIKENDSDELETALDRTKDILLSLKVGQILSEAEYIELSRKFAHVFEAGKGAEAVRKILGNVNLEKEAKEIEEQLKELKGVGQEQRLLYRLKLIRSFIKNNMRPEWMILTVLPILPPELRPMVALDGGRYATSDLNDLYRRVINRNNRLKNYLN